MGQSYETIKYKNYIIEIRNNSKSSISHLKMNVWEATVYNPQNTIIANFNSPDRRSVLAIAKYHINYTLSYGISKSKSKFLE
jgi:soluble lytic murein transglycosylase-like protein